MFLSLIQNRKFINEMRVCNGSIIKLEIFKNILYSNLVWTLLSNLSDYTASADKDIKLNFEIFFSAIYKSLKIEFRGLITRHYFQGLYFEDTLNHFLF